MNLSIRTKGLAKARAGVQKLPAVLSRSAEISVRESVRNTREFVIKRTLEQYNLPEPTLREHVRSKSITRTSSGASGIVEIRIRAVPLTEFNPKVEVFNMRFTQAFGRPSKAYKRKMARVRVALYRGRRAKVLAGGFPLEQRSPGLLRSEERVRRRRDDRDGTKLTGFRYFTFPKRLTERLIQRAQREAGKQLQLTFRVAYRNNFRELRLNK